MNEFVAILFGINNAAKKLTIQLHLLFIFHMSLMPNSFFNIYIFHIPVYFLFHKLLVSNVYTLSCIILLVKIIATVT